MSETTSQRDFVKHFAGRMIPFTRMGAGHARQLAETVNEAQGRGDASLHTDAELGALFDLLRQEPGSDAGARGLRLRDAAGQPTAASRLIESFRGVALDKPAFFSAPMYIVEITGWAPRRLPPDAQPTAAGADSRLRLWPTDPADAQPAPPPGVEGVLFSTSLFTLSNSGNRTAGAPKRSWKIQFEARGQDDDFDGMKRLNLKSMWNDPAQMRESLAWNLFDTAGVPACRHSYAKLSIDGRYFGLYFLIEQIDRPFLRDRFGENNKGNLYKVYYGDKPGGGALLHLTGADNDDSGRQYISPAAQADATYRLKTNENDAAANTYDDLAAFIRCINAIGQPGDDRFRTDAFRRSVEAMFNVWPFLRWAAVNILLGSWDNYFATPANYYLYNAGRRNRADDFVAAPFFTFIPWDYDNSFGIDYTGGTEWQYTDLMDWPSNTARYLGRNGARSRIPLVENLLQHPDFIRYYLDQIEFLLDTAFNPDTVSRQIGVEGAGGLWDRVRGAAFLESATPTGSPSTGRQFSNDTVYRAAVQQQAVQGGGPSNVYGIVNYVRMRHDRARARLAELRPTYAKGSSRAGFPAKFQAFPRNA
jgi:hypothetical protein